MDHAESALPAGFLDDLRHAADEDEGRGHHLQADYIRNAAAAIERLTAERDRLRAALVNLVYEVTHLSPQREDGSHDCRISAEALQIARKALEASADG
jgi:hypothetical protein